MYFSTTTLKQQSITVFFTFRTTSFCQVIHFIFLLKIGRWLHRSRLFSSFHYSKQYNLALQLSVLIIEATMCISVSKSPSWCDHISGVAGTRDDSIWKKLHRKRLEFKCLPSVDLHNTGGVTKGWVDWSHILRKNKQSIRFCFCWLPLFLIINCSYYKFEKKRKKMLGPSRRLFKSLNLAWLVGSILIHKLLDVPTAKVYHLYKCLF
jgi:hypothetical protein